NPGGGISDQAGQTGCSPFCSTGDYLLNSGSQGPSLGQPIERQPVLLPVTPGQSNTAAAASPSSTSTVQGDVALNSSSSGEFTGGGGGECAFDPDTCPGGIVPGYRNDP